MGREKPATNTGNSTGASTISHSREGRGVARDPGHPCAEIRPGKGLATHCRGGSRGGWGERARALPPSGWAHGPPPPLKACSYRQGMAKARGRHRLGATPRHAGRPAPRTLCGGHASPSLPPPPLSP